jgi:hypothetical protein
LVEGFFFAISTLSASRILVYSLNIVRSYSITSGGVFLKVYGNLKEKKQLQAERMAKRIIIGKPL